MGCGGPVNIKYYSIKHQHAPHSMSLKAFNNNNNNMFCSNLYGKLNYMLPI